MCHCFELLTRPYNLMADLFVRSPCTRFVACGHLKSTCGIHQPLWHHCLFWPTCDTAIGRFSCMLSRSFAHSVLFIQKVGAVLLSRTAFRLAETSLSSSFFLACGRKCPCRLCSRMTITGCAYNTNWMVIPHVLRSGLRHRQFFNA